MLDLELCLTELRSGADEFVVTDYTALETNHYVQIFASSEVCSPGR